MCSLFLEVCKAQHFEGIIQLNPELDGVRVSLFYDPRKTDWGIQVCCIQAYDAVFPRDSRNVCGLLYTKFLLLLAGHYWQSY